MSTTSTQSAQIYENATEGLQTLTKLWETMLNIIHSVSTASGSSLTVEPDLIALQKTRRELEQLLKSLQSTASWLDNVDMPEHSNQSDSEEYVELLKENKSAVEEAERVSDQLRRLLSKSYALQLLMEMLQVSSKE
ncbi:hypothetical protein G6F70_008335 [Rhizopus microsporus]|uniref:Uncharacterized protein n=2 Tax=Rhizopus TaxID=4842 RepID=A0A367JLH1_RHIAZ|nr:hypothetical protein G6F70_008335 [Rhizopus microsporus]RCH90778.1 hypothetical protein CU097_008651 [Rhizopus azygosporus]KAG1207313.1 hypothetical protein G6F69_008151 [Rhizopus microsporus]KAG1227972.1 hypothetical protein G6F67_008117 [Rhizopus microsporus]KAG1260029.1 hypothetical protein G6F68_007719 [Rhizopus microsporus]